MVRAKRKNPKGRSTSFPYSIRRICCVRTGGERCRATCREGLRHCDNHHILDKIKRYSERFQRLRSIILQSLSGQGDKIDVLELARDECIRVKKEIREVRSRAKRLLMM